MCLHQSRAATRDPVQGLGRGRDGMGTEAASPAAAGSSTDRTMPSKSELSLPPLPQASAVPSLDAIGPSPLTYSCPAPGSYTLADLG